MNNRIRIPTRFSDRINHTYSFLYIPEIHLILDFDSKLNQERLRDALRLLVDAEPVLGCRFVNHWLRPYWDRFSELELDDAEILKTEWVDQTACEKLTLDFLSEELNWEKVPQIAALIISMKNYDRLILKVNHSVCDAGGFKFLLNLLADIYRRLGNRPDYFPVPNEGSRSLWQVYKRFSPVQLFDITRSGFYQFFRVYYPAEGFQYPSGKERAGNLHFIFKHFSKERVREIVKYGNSHNATVNDLFVTALLRAMIRQTGWNGDRRLALAGTVDLRRYLTGRQAEALCQVSGIYFVKITESLGKDFTESLAFVKKDLDYNKADYFGLGIIFVSKLIWLPYPYSFTRKINKFIWERAYRKGTVGPGFTNLGPIDNQFHNFGGPDLVSAFMTTPGSCPPFIFLGMSGYAGTLTLSSGIYESAVPRSAMEELFDMVDQELPS